MSRNRSRALVASAAVTAVVAAVALAPSANATTSTDVVINEVYGGGGNSGATLTNDFIELHNNGSQAVPLGSWSVQYISAAPGATTTWQVTDLTGSIAPGGSYLVQEAAGAGGSSASSSRRHVCRIRGSRRPWSGWWSKVSAWLSQYPASPVMGFVCTKF